MVIPESGTIPPSVTISERIHIHLSVSKPVVKSCLLPGILIECEDELDLLGAVNHRGHMTTALFDISLSGDLPEG